MNRDRDPRATAPRGGGFFTTSFEEPAPVPREAAGALRKIVIAAAIVEAVLMLVAVVVKLGLWPF